MGKNLGVDCRMALCTNREVKNCWGIEKESVSEDSKNGFVNKWEGNREVKISWDGGINFWWRFERLFYAEVGLWKLTSSYHFAENLARFVFKIELLVTMLSNFEREAVLKDLTFQWVAWLTHKFFWSAYSLITNLSGLDWHM